MDNANVVIIALALLVLMLLVNNKAIATIAAVVSVILVVGALKSPDIAAGAAIPGTPDDQLQGTIVLVVLILGIPLVNWWMRK